MTTIKLNQALAIEKSVKAKAYNETTELHKALQKDEPLNGFVKTYQKIDDNGLDLPPESQKVQLDAEQALARVAKINAEAWDVEATKDYGNTRATADVEVDGKVVIANAPPTFLLYLEKQLSDMRTFIAKTVALDQSKEWKRDEKTGLWASEPRKTHRTEKVQRAIVKYAATEQHPAQTEMVTQDVIAGYWTTIHYSGALSHTRKRDIIEKIDKLANAVKAAREKANTTEIDKVNVGAGLLDYLFK